MLSDMHGQNKKPTCNCDSCSVGRPAHLLPHRHWTTEQLLLCFQSLGCCAPQLRDFTIQPKGNQNLPSSRKEISVEVKEGSKAGGEGVVRGEMRAWVCVASEGMSAVSTFLLCDILRYCIGAPGSGVRVLRRVLSWRPGG